MKHIITLLSLTPSLGVGFSVVLLFLYSLDYPLLIFPMLFNAVAFVYLLDNSGNVAQNIYSAYSHLKDILYEKEI